MLRIFSSRKAVFLLLLIILASIIESKAKTTTPEPEEDEDEDGGDDDENKGTGETGENDEEAMFQKYVKELNEAPCMMKSKCEFDPEIMTVVCKGFKNFSEIRLDCKELLNNRITEYIQSIYFRPAAPLIIDSSFDPSKIKLPIMFYIFSNTNGICLLYTSRRG